MGIISSGGSLRVSAVFSRVQYSWKQAHKSIRYSTKSTACSQRQEFPEELTHETLHWLDDKRGVQTYVMQASRAW